MEQPSQYVIEIQNVSQQVVMLTCPAKAPLMMVHADGGRKAERVALTSEQFLSMAYDLEGFVEGKHGVKKLLALFVTERESGRCEEVDFKVGYLVATHGLSADAEAAEAQAEQEAKIDAARVKANASAQPNPNTLEGSVQQGLNGIS